MWVRAAAVTVVVAALAAVLLGRAGVFSTSLAAGSGGTPQSWQTYHDPLGLFTLRLPPDWTAVVESGTGGISNSHGIVTEREYVVNFDDPAQRTGSAHVSVIAVPLKTTFDRQYICQNANTPYQRFSPLTLRSMEPSGLSLFTTETAFFQVNVAIPGVVAPDGYGLPLLPQPTVTPIPSTWAATDQSEVNAMLVSFQPTDPKPLAC
jgi:hypothetical protein